MMSLLKFRVFWRTPITALFGFRPLIQNSNFLFSNSSSFLLAIALTLFEFLKSATVQRDFHTFYISFSSRAIFQTLLTLYCKSARLYRLNSNQFLVD